MDSEKEPAWDSEITQEIPGLDETREIPFLGLPAHLRHDPILNMLPPLEDRRTLYDRMHPQPLRRRIRHRRGIPLADKILLGLGVVIGLLTGVLLMSLVMGLFTGV